MDQIAYLDDRAVLAVSGPDASAFLQGLVTNDVLRLSEGASIYAALLTPQGKILFDFLLFRRSDAYLLDCWSGHHDALLSRLLLYRLRSKVTVEPSESLAILGGWGAAPPPAEGTIDPRLGALGWRAIIPKSDIPEGVARASAYLPHRLDCGVPEGSDFGQDKIFALDACLEELHGVSFEKGCYVGQELTARMKHRGTARKRLVPVATLSGADLGERGSSVTSGALDLGTTVSVYSDRGFALLRLDRLAEAGNEPIQIAGHPVRVVQSPWLFA